MKIFAILFLPTIVVFGGCYSPGKTPSAVETKADSIWASHSSVLFEELIERFKLDDSLVFVSTQPHRDPPSDCYDAIFESLFQLGVVGQDTRVWENEWKRVTQWDSLFFSKHFKLISGDTIPDRFADSDQEWEYFKEHIGSGFFTFSVPIFFDDHRYALVYASQHCNGLCGYGAWFILKRENGHWITVDEHCFWIS